MAEVIVPAVANPVAENWVNAIGRQFGYLWNYSKNMDNLTRQVKTLEGKRNDMNSSITDARNNAMVVGDQVKNWVSEAEDIIGQAKQILEHKEKGKMRCRVGLCPNLVSRHRLGRKACDIVTEVADVITKFPIGEVFFRPLGQNKTILSTEGFSTFDSRKSILKNIVKALQTEPMVTISHGFGGMGKTTLANQVAKQAEEEKLFEEIVFASVTQKVDMKEIQGQLASMLDLKLEESTKAERASRIHQRLKGKKVLVILDDLWKELDLKEVGVPFGAEHMGCKILLTSRFRPVLTSMGTQQDFNLGALDEEEGWRLFEEKVGGSVLKSSNFHDIGKKVAKRCQGFPVLIVTVSASLSKRQELSAWKEALRQLKKMDRKDIQEIVNSAIESISYNHLEKTHKQLFVLCGVIGGVASVEEVLQYSWGSNLFDGEAATIQEARDRLNTLIIDLKESCLLLDDVNERNSIKMHDVVRDVAISIGSKDLNMFSIREHGVESNIWRRDDDLKRCTAMVLRGCPNIPPLLECPSLELFVMSGLSEDSSSSIPESFFEKTSKLKVLRLSQLSFTALPPSLSFLKNLQTLRVNDCDSLKDISIVGELNKLQILSFAGSDIEELPSGIGKLSELRSLDVRRCRNLKVIPAGLIEGLTRLEELYVSRYFKEWEAEESVNGSVKLNASLLELKHLHNLCSLEVRAGDDKFLLEDLHFEKLERYEIIVGDWGIFDLCDLDEIEVTRKFCVQLSSTSINDLHGVKRLFERAECVWLGELKGIKNVTPALDGNGFSNLKHLRIQDNYEIQYVVNVEDKQRKAVFPYLESLHLEHLVKLPKVCNGPLMKGSFQNLTSVKVEDCNELKSLFSFSMATGLPWLQEIEVSNCDALEAIVAEKNIKDDINDGVCEEIVEFAQLRKLTLECLPKLKNFFSNGEIQNKSQKSLQESEIYTGEEDELKSSLPFFTKVTFPKLELLELAEIFNLTEIWSHKFQEISCSTLRIRNCKNLKHVFPSSVAPSLSKLESLYVEDCEVMKTIIGDESHENEEIIKVTRHEHVAATFMFARLIELGLLKLPKVECFYSREHTIECSALTSIDVDDCGKLSALDFLSFQKKQGDNLFEKVPSKLETLHMRKRELTKILELYDHFPTHLFSSLVVLHIVEFHGGSVVFPSVSFKSLQYLEVKDCGGLTNLVQLSTATSLEQLLCLTIIGCEMMEKVIDDDDDDEEEEEESSREDDNEIIFPNLYKLYLEKLPRLTNFSLSPNYTFNFPKLCLLEVRECPNMKTFCGGTTTTPNLDIVEYEDERRWEGDLNTTVQKIFAEMEAKRLTTTLPSTSSSNHVEANAIVHENELTEPIPAAVQNGTNPEKEFEVSDDSIESRKGSETFMATVDTREKGKGKQVEVSEEVMEHSIKFQEIDGSVSIASSSKLSNHSEEFPRLTTSLPSTSSNNQEAEIHGKAAEPTKEPQICKHVVDDITDQATFTENVIEPIIATEIGEELVDICAQHVLPSSNTNFEVEAQLHYESSKKVSEGRVRENAADKSAKLEDRELAPLLPSNSSTNHIEATAQVPENDANNAEKTADTFEEGSVSSSEESNPPAQTSLSHSTELEVQRSTSTVESKATDPKKGSEIDEEVLQGVKLADISDKAQEQLHPSKSNTLQVTCQQKDRIHVKSAEKVNDEPTGEIEIGDQELIGEGQVADAYDKGKGKEYDVTEETVEPRNETSHCLKTEPETGCIVASSSHQESLGGFRESFQILEAQPMSRVSAEQVRFMEEASEWFSGYVKQAREYMEQKELISELELKIDDMEAQLQVLKEKKRVAEEKKNAASRVAKFG